MIDDIAAIAAGAGKPLAGARSGARGTDFAALLAGAGVARPDAAAADALGRAPAMDLDPRRLTEETAALGKDLTSRLRALGVDTSIPIDLEIAGDGSIRVRGDHPNKARIEELFAADKELANRYRMIAARQTLLAIVRIAAEFHARWDDVEDEEERRYLWQDFRERIRQVSANSGNMTLAGGTLAPSPPA